MNLKELAKEKGTNLKKVAEKCGVPASTLYAISSGDTNFENVGIGLFIKIADALEISTDELYRGKSGVHYATVDMGETVRVSSDERELLRLYRAMSPEYKSMMMKNAVAYAEMTSKSGCRDCGDVAGIGAVR